jgi:hypothetical protein
MVYDLLRALPGDRALLPPSPLRSLLLKNLTPASRRQDHTTSPSASGALVRSTLRVHRIPSRVRDDREPPLMWDGMAANIPMICNFGKSEYFCNRGWTSRPAKHRARHTDLPVGSGDGGGVFRQGVDSLARSHQPTMVATVPYALNLLPLLATQPDRPGRE